MVYGSYLTFLLWTESNLFLVAYDQIGLVKCLVNDVGSLRFYNLEKRREVH